MNAIHAGAYVALGVAIFAVLAAREQIKAFGWVLILLIAITISDASRLALSSVGIQTGTLDFLLYSIWPLSLAVIVPMSYGEKLDAAVVGGLTLVSLGAAWWVRDLLYVTEVLPLIGGALVVITGAAEGRERPLAVPWLCILAAHGAVLLVGPWTTSLSSWYVAQIGYSLGLLGLVVTTLWIWRKSSPSRSDSLSSSRSESACSTSGGSTSG